MTSEEPRDADPSEANAEAGADLDSLKYHLLGPSLTKAGQDSVDQTKVGEIIYNASKGSKFFNREEIRDKVLTEKIANILEKKARLQTQDTSRDRRLADQRLAELELGRDLSQTIVHIDCDAFYAAVEQLDRPELRDVPFAVGGGVLTTCNYAARRFGCRSGMAGFVAKKLCPQLVMLKPDFAKYNAKAHEVREVLAEYDPRFESASIDEAYLNITEYCAEKGLSAADAVAQMRREVHERTKVTVSAGIAANAKLAKICSNVNKPNGQFVLENDRATILAFMRDLPTRNVNGIGRVLERELSAVGIRTCGDVYEHRALLRPLFGDKACEFLLACYLGLGRTHVQPAEEYERKSVGTESTFREMSDPAQLRDKLRRTAEALEKDMQRAGCRGRTLCLKVKLHTFEVYTRQVVPPKALCLADELYEHALPMLAKLEQEMPGIRLRLMGLRCTHLVSTKKPDTMAFFGFRPRKEGEGEGTDSPYGLGARSGSVQLDEDGWEKWPGDELSAADDGPVEDQGPSDQDDSELYNRHGKEIAPNPKKRGAEDEEDDLWDCPICGRPQPAYERQFNEHIDLCLSRQTIRSAAQEDGQSTPARPVTPEVKRPKLKEKKRGRSDVDPRQKKLAFG